MNKIDWKVFEGSSHCAEGLAMFAGCEATALPRCERPAPERFVAMRGKVLLMLTVTPEAQLLVSSQSALPVLQ